jgi:hypothetical protein
MYGEYRSVSYISDVISWHSFEVIGPGPITCCELYWGFPGSTRHELSVLW